MNLLVDTNVVVEILLKQEQSGPARAALNLTEQHVFFFSDFSVHSVGVILFRRGRKDIFNRFLQDLTFRARRQILYLSLSELSLVSSAAEHFNLDFDDAYQYALAEKHDLTILSFDHDFDRTARGRTTPAQLLE